MFPQALPFTHFFGPPAAEAGAAEATLVWAAGAAAGEASAAGHFVNLPLASLQGPALAGAAAAAAGAGHLTNFPFASLQDSAPAPGSGKAKTQKRRWRGT